MRSQRNKVIVGILVRILTGWFYMVGIYLIRGREWRRF